jgi:predicted ATPase/DNA-binding SARP family transcriptional activator
MQDPGVVQVRLFGGVRVSDEAGAPVDVGPAKCQTLLAALALSAGAAVPVSRLVELVWGPEPPRTADKTLQSYVTRLRKGVGPEAIARVGAAYRLDLAPDDVDVMRFQRLLAAGDVEAALAEWTGPPLAGLDASGLAATVDALVEQWLGAVEQQLARRVESDAVGAIGPLTELTATHPFREGLWALLMTALYRVGRQADALAAYRRARHHLVEELGIEPGPRLRELEASILGHDEQLRVDRAPRGPDLGPPIGTVTFGFSDVDDAARLWARHRQEAGTALARHDQLVRETAERHGGFVFATGGDSFGVAFHRATDAARWAAEVQAAMAREPGPGGAAVSVRIGLHTGETQERERGYFGPAVIVAARLAAAGHGGQTLASGVTAALLDTGESGDAGNGWDLRDLGTFRLDGVVTEQRIVQVGEGEHPPPRTAEGRRGNLPRRAGRLIGREDELEVVAEALAAAPVVTLVGPGGIGKTRLALAAAARAAVDVTGGTWLVDLAVIAAPDDVPRAVAAILDVRESPGRTLTESVVAALQPRRALLLLDNCEHVVDGVARLARAVADGCPSVRILATSREGLGLGNGHEWLVAVPPLDPGGAGVELFAERAAALSPTFDAAAGRDQIEEICRRLDGVPLAIELAAARTATLAPTELVERLDDRLRLLTGGRRTSVERHRTMRATIQWSYDLLAPPEQVLFQRLSIFAGPFDLAAAETVAAGTGLDAADVDDLLGGLVDRSMVMVESGPFGRRFRLAETMRQFGAEHLSGGGQTDLVAERHARWCLDRVEHVGRLLPGTGEFEAVARLDELWPNLRAAVGWACATGDAALARALIRPIVTEVYVRSRSEIGDWAERILALAGPGDEDLVVFGLTWAARRYMRHLDRDGFERLVSRFGEPDHPMIRFARGFVYSDYGIMGDCAHAALAELRRNGDDYVADMFEIVGLGLTLIMTGHLAEHDALLAPRVDRSRAEGPPTCLNWALTQLATSASLQGRPQEAWRLFDEAARVAVPARTHSLRNPLAARTALRRGDRAGAFRMLRSYVDELLVHENMYLARLGCVEFVDLMAAAGNLAEAGRIIDHLDATGALDGTLPYKSMVADAAAAVAEGTATPADAAAAVAEGTATPADAAAAVAEGTATPATAAPPRPLDDRGALVYMRDSLDRLATATDGSDASAPAR